MNKFITISSGLNGQFFIILADNDGPIERLDCDSFDCPEAAEEYGKKLAREYGVRFL